MGNAAIRQPVHLFGPAVGCADLHPWREVGGYLAISDGGVGNDLRDRSGRGRAPFKAKALQTASCRWDGSDSVARAAPFRPQFRCCPRIRVRAHACHIPVWTPGRGVCGRSRAGRAFYQRDVAAGFSIVETAFDPELRHRMGASGRDHRRDDGGDRLGISCAQKASGTCRRRAHGGGSNASKRRNGTAKMRFKPFRRHSAWKRSGVLPGACPTM